MTNNTRCQTCGAMAELRCLDRHRPANSLCPHHPANQEPVVDHPHFEPKSSAILQAEQAAGRRSTMPTEDAFGVPADSGRYIGLRPRKSASEIGKFKSDGGSSDYYLLPPAAEDLDDLIRDREMSFARGNVFKACYRLGLKDGSDIDYDIKKMEFFVGQMKKLRKEGHRV